MNELKRRLAHIPRIYWLAGAAASIILIATIVIAKQKAQWEYIPYNPAFDPYLSAFTEGEISRTDDIILRFQDDVLGKDALATATEAPPITFEPAIPGRLVWFDSRTMKFQPKDWLPSETRYTASVDMKALIPNIPDSLRKFRFQFATKPQAVEVQLAEIKSVDRKTLKKQRISADLKLNDVEKLEVLQEAVNAEQNGKQLPIKWHYNRGQTRQHFEIAGITRSETPSELVVDYGGLGYGMSGKKNTLRIPIPPLDNFEIVDVYVTNSPVQSIVMEFSDPLNEAQNIDGLVSLGGKAFTWRITGHQITLFPKNRITGDVKVEVLPGIENSAKYKLKEKLVRRVKFEALKPQVKITGNGVIIPQGKTLPFVFEAVGLKAVDVRVTKIYESNVPQFLQVNQLWDNGQIHRVGRVQTIERVPLDQDKSIDLNDWNKHVLDLSKLIENEPGAIYEVSIGFRQSDALCDCPNRAISEATGEPEDERDERAMIEEGRGWDGERYFISYGGYYSYNYYERNDPCKASYYTRDKVVSRNVLASSIGLIAKQGADDRLFVATTHIETTDPLSGVQLEVLDFQQKPLATATSDDDGQLFIPVKSKHKPFLLIAKYGNQRGYLRLDDGSALAMNKFDIKGAMYRNGMRAFIYGERGVWRPGDPMHLTAMLKTIDDTPKDLPLTAELYNPQGQLVKKQRLTESVNGFYAFTLQTDSEAPTGTYNLKLHAGGATFTKPLKVETVMPNRLKVKLDIPDKLIAGKPANATIESHWLHGAVAKNLKAEIKGTLIHQKTNFQSYPTYTFDDPFRPFSGDSRVFFADDLDENGQAKFKVNFELNDKAPGKLRLNVFTKVFEPGGAFSRDYYSTDYDPYTTYVGIDAPEPKGWSRSITTGKDHRFEVATVSTDGQARGNRKINVELYKLKWRWWWDRDNERYLSYNSQQFSNIVDRKTLTTDSRGRANFTLNRSDDEWGRYLVRLVDEGGHSTGTIVYFDSPGYYGRSARENPDAAKMLTFSTDQEQYTVGDEITLNLPTGDGGRALVSIENGAKVLKTYWIDAVEGTTRFRFEADESMAPNVYAHVTLLQPHSQTANDLPLRMYGLLPITVNNPATKLQPKLSTPTSIRPNQEVQVRVSEAAGKPMTYTVAVVDEGLLDLTRFTTPNPHGFFYQRQALGVKTWDLFDMVVAKDPDKIRALLSIGGGDGRIYNENATEQNRFRPVVKFLGPFELEAGQTKTHSYKMPNYVGSVRTMLIAGDIRDGRFGHSEVTSKVNSPLMVLGTLPRVLSPGEEIDLPVSVFATEARIRNADVTVVARDNLQLASGQTQSVSFDGSGKDEKLLTFKLKVPESVGRGEVRIVATGGGESAVYETGIEIRLPNPRVTRIQTDRIEPGQRFNANLQPVGMKGTNEITLEISALPPINLEQRLKYLIRYPYGCLEQTVSSTFAQLYLPELIKLSPERRDRVRTNLNAAIARLSHFQNDDGGFSYWPRGGYVSDWASNYAGHFMLEARAHGYLVPDLLFNNWAYHTRREAREFKSSASQYKLKTQAYRLYLLSKTGRGDMSAMNRLIKIDNLPNLAKWYLAAAYHNSGQPETASRLIRRLPTKVGDYAELGLTFGSGTRDEAVILEVLSLTGRQSKARGVLESLSNTLSSERWLSTQTTAYALMAFGKYVEESNITTRMQFKLEGASHSAEDLASKQLIWQRALDPTSIGTVKFKNTSDLPLYVSVISSGVPLQGDQTSESSGLVLDLRYETPTGRRIDVDNMKQGTDFVAIAVVRNTSGRNLQNIALTQMFPAGWEILNERMGAVLGSSVSDEADYRDLRDDRVNSFFDLRKGQEKTFRAYLNASYLGKFYLPTVQAQAMYDNTITADKPGKWVRVVE